MEDDAFPDELNLLLTGPFSDAVQSSGQATGHLFSPTERPTSSSFTHQTSSLTNALGLTFSVSSPLSDASSSPSTPGFSNLARRIQTNQLSKEPVASGWTSSLPCSRLESLLTTPPSRAQNSCSQANEEEEEDDVTVSEQEVEEGEEQDGDDGLRGPRAYLETRVATPSGLEFSISYSLRDLHRDLLRGERAEPWYSREPPRLPLRTDAYYCQRGTVARSRRSAIIH